VEEAISTVGGIAIEEVGSDLALLKHPRMFVAGEMIDIDAPTGGYLLQAAFSMGIWAAKAMLVKLSGRKTN
jgi:predicted flavoprotein YhiN